MEFLSTFTNFKQNNISIMMLDILEELCQYNNLFDVFTKDEDRIYCIWSILSIFNNKGKIIYIKL